MKKTLVLIGKGAGVCLFFWAAFLMLMTPRTWSIVPEDEKLRAYVFWTGTSPAYLRSSSAAKFCTLAETSVKRVGEDLYTILICENMKPMADGKADRRYHLGTLRRLPDGTWSLVGVTVPGDHKEAPARQFPKGESTAPSKLEVLLDRYLGGEADWSLFLEDLA